MIHNKVDFSKNINAYYDSGENKKAEKLLMAELGQLMIYHRGHIISALNEAGIETNKDASDKEIANKLASNLAYNDGLRIAISLLLNNLNANSFYQATGCPEGYIKQYFNAEDDASGGGFGAFLSSLTGILGGGASGGASGGGGSGGASSRGSSGSVPATQVTVGSDPVSAIAGAIGSIFSFAGSKTAQKTEREKSKSEKDIQRLALAQQILGAKNSQQPPTGMSGGTKATIIILGLLAVGTTVYFVMKKK
tara:strand:+ start:1103 stop:1855 length:753 start_codon:yes stop_codon:yes gene_type:complete